MTSDDARKLRVVLRARDGDPVEVIDSSGRCYAGELRLEGRSTCAWLGSTRAVPPPLRLSCTLAQAVPKGTKMDFIVEKATELGAAGIVPFTSERTIGTARREGKRERWQRVAQSAARQCGRHDVPLVDQPLAFGAVCDRFANFDAALVAWELTARIPLRDVLPPIVATARRVLVVIGPEGGLSAEEVALAERSGGSTISLGARILRTETAGLVLCSALLYAAGDL